MSAKTFEEWSASKEALVEIGRILDGMGPDEGPADMRRKIRELVWNSGRSALLAERPDVAGPVKEQRRLIAMSGGDIANPTQAAMVAALESLAAQLAEMTAELALRREAETAFAQRFNAVVEERDGLTEALSIANQSADEQMRYKREAEAESARLREALRELLETTLSQIPPYEAGRDAQDAWADRCAKARNDAAAINAERAGK